MNCSVEKIAQKVGLISSYMLEFAAFIAVTIDVFVLNFKSILVWVLCGLGATPLGPSFRH